MKAAFIVIEGLEGAGKSTVISAIETMLQEKGHAVICTREPGGTPMAEAIRNCVKQQWDNEHVTQQTELLLMYAARSQLVSNVIKPSLEKGIFVIGDRHDLSSIAYQGGGRGVPLDDLKQLKHLTLGNFAPDFTVYLDIEPEVGLARARGRGELDRIELSGLAFFKRARHVYLSEVNKLSHAVKINAEQSQSIVKHEVLSAVSCWLDSRQTYSGI